MINMGWKDHLKWGLISSIILLIILLMCECFFEFPFEFESIFKISRFVIYGFAIPNIIIAFIGGLYGSIFPDIDIGTSKAFYLTFMIILPILFYYVFIGYILGLLIGLILMVCIVSLKHRGIMHKSYTAIIIGFIVFIFFNSIIIALFFTIGFMVHLACDRDLGDD